MLTELYLENFVLFERTALEFGPGLNVISGETGAGKSLVAQALALALGRRAQPELIRADADEAVLTAVYRLPDASNPRFLGEGNIAPDEDGCLVFTRQLRRDGRSRLTLCSRPISSTAARDLGARLTDLVAQNEYTRLLDPGFQLELLDAYGGLSREVEAFHALFTHARGLAARMQASDAQRTAAAQRLEEVHRLRQELEALGPDPTSDAALEDRIRFLSEADSIRLLTERAEAELYENETSIHDTIARLLRDTQPYGEHSPHLAAALRHLTSILAEVDDAVQAFRHTADTIPADPQALESCVERSEALKRIARRCNCAIDDLQEQQQTLEREADQLAAWNLDAAALQEELQGVLPSLIDAGLALRRARQRAAKRLAAAVNRELKDLGMGAAGFAVALESLWEEEDAPDRLLGAAHPTGLETVAFRLAPNPGEADSPLATAASGGETSRTMLALKSALASVHGPPVLFFDEIDAGIGGRLGDTIARKLRALAVSHQVIVITHLPQVAASADLHLRVDKIQQQGRTVAVAQRLEGEARVDEVAQMIHGESSTATTRSQALEMLHQHTAE